MLCARFEHDDPKESLFKRLGMNSAWSWRIKGAIGAAIAVLAMFTLTSTIVYALNPIISKAPFTIKGIIVIGFVFAFAFAIVGFVGGAILGVVLGGRRSALKGAIGGVVGFIIGGGVIIGLIGETLRADLLLTDAIGNLAVWAIDHAPVVIFMGSIIGMVAGSFIGGRKGVVKGIMGAVIGFIFGGIIALTIVYGFSCIMTYEIRYALAWTIILSIGGGIGSSFWGAFLYGRKGAIKGLIGGAIGFAIANTIIFATEIAIMPLIGIAVGGLILGVFIGEVAARME